MRKITRNQLLNLLLTIATITVNGLANALPLNGLNTGEISDRFKIFFVPAGYVFSIWGLIYLGLIAFAVFQALPAQRDNNLIDKISPYYWLASIANSVWIFLWHYEVFALTVVAMLALLFSLIKIYLLIRQETGLTLAFKAFVSVVFSVYLGWITVATVANVSQLLNYLGWKGGFFAEPTWAAIMLVVAMALGLLALALRGDIAYTLVLVWAFIGIALKHNGYPLVVYTAWITTAILALGVVGVGLRQLTRKA